MKVRLQEAVNSTYARIVRGLVLAAVAAGVVVAGWTAFLFLGPGSDDREAARKEPIRTAASLPVAAPAAPKVRVPRPNVAEGGRLGRFEMPRLGLSYEVLEGTSDRTLDKGLGRVANTGWIGESGNIGIAGHRNTHFRKLEWAREGDEIILSSDRGRFRYKVEWARLHQPADVFVLDPAQGPAITLITCFPFEYVGSAPLRFIVRAIPDDETRARLALAP
jgi:sortase A